MTSRQNNYLARIHRAIVDIICSTDNGTSWFAAIVCNKTQFNAGSNLSDSRRLPNMLPMEISYTPAVPSTTKSQARTDKFLRQTHRQRNCERPLAPSMGPLSHKVSAIAVGATENATSNVKTKIFFMTSSVRRCVL